MSDLKTELELAQRMFGPSTGGGLGQGVRRISATAIADSADGTVELDVGGETVEVPVVGHVSSGDEVSVLVEDGAAYAIGTDGWGDSVQATASSASAIATAVNQHVWTDTSGVHVTEQDQDATTGANVLLNSQGLLLRDGTDDLAAFASGGVEFYDGTATTASFNSSGAVLGGDTTRGQLTLDADPPDPIFDPLFRVAYNGTNLLSITPNGRIDAVLYGTEFVDGWKVEKRPSSTSLPIIEATITVTGSIAATTSYGGRYISALRSQALPSSTFTVIEYAHVSVFSSPGLWDSAMTNVTASALGYYVVASSSLTQSVTLRFFVRGH